MKWNRPIVLEIGAVYYDTQMVPNILGRSGDCCFINFAQTLSDVPIERCNFSVVVFGPSYYQCRNTQEKKVRAVHSRLEGVGEDLENFKNLHEWYYCN